MFIITKTIQAEEDLIEIWLNIATHSTAAADNLLNRFERFFSTLSEQPEMGKIIKGLEKNWPAKVIRFFPVDDYIIFYHFDDKTIKIVRVLHCALDYTRIFKSH